MTDPLALALRSLSAAELPGPAFDDPPGPPPGLLDLPPLTGAPAPTEVVRRAVAAARLGAFTEIITEPAAPGAGPLAGVPVAVKDNIDVAGQWTRNGTASMGHRKATEDSAAWQRLRAAGAVLIGRTRMHELAWGVTTPGCRNPRDTTRGTGGSSGGSAAAVAAGVVPVALGTDTGGSIRIPAALCGVAGLRPTAGTVSRRGVTPLAPTLDTVGPIARTAADCLLVHAVLGGGTAAPAGSRIGLPAALWRGRVTGDVAGALAEAAERLCANGIEPVEVDLPLARAYARPASYVVMLAEAAALWAAALAADPGSVESGTAELLRRGTTVPVAGYRHALRISAAIRAEVDAALGGHGLAALLLPATPVTAAPAGAESVEINGRTVPIDSAYAHFTALASVSGHPALTVPIGTGSDGLPIGGQLVGARHTEAALCRLGGLIETVSPKGKIHET